ncbi:MAG: gliding motility-associated C-terminal domain-containing protein, partial [Saprospiraceae bacterium]
RWRGPNNFISTSPSPTINYPDADFTGSYELTIEQTGGCTQTTTVQVDPIREGIPQPIISSTGPACAGQTIRLQVPQYIGNQIDYVWSLPDSTNVTGWNTHEIVISPLTEDLHTGNYQVSVTVDGCETISDTYNLSIFRSLTVEPFLVGAICAGENLQLFANTSSSVQYEWQGPNGFYSIAENPLIPNVQTIDRGTYTLTATTESGCSYVGATDLTEVQSQLPTPAIVASTSCAGETIELATSFVYPPNTEYVWYDDEGEIIGRTATLEIESEQIENAPFRVEVNRNDCPTPLSTGFTPEITALPVVIAEPVSTICAGSSVELRAERVAGALYEWYNLNTAELVSTQVQTTVISVDTTTTFEVRMRFLDCENYTSDQVKVEVVTIPTVEALPTETVFCYGEEIILTANGLTNSDEVIRYSWSRTGGFSYTGIAPAAGPFPAPLAAVGNNLSGTYQLELTNSAGCSSIAASTTLKIEGRLTTPELSVEQSIYCAGSPLLLETTSTQPNEQFHWYYSDGQRVDTLGVSTQASWLIPSIASNQSGFYSVQSSVNGCFSTVSAFEQVLVFGTDINLQPSHQSATSISAQIDPVGNYCVGDNIQLILPYFPGVTYEWFGPNNYTSTSANPIISNATTAANGDYYATITLGECTTIITEPINIKVDNVPVTPAIDTSIFSDPSRPSVCADASITLQTTSVLSESNDIQYNWFYNDQLLVNTTQPYLSLADTINNRTGSYQLQIIQDNCASPLSGALSLQVDTLPVPLPIADAGKDTSYCATNQFTVAAESYAFGVGEWSSPTGAKFIDPNQAITTVENVSVGENILVWNLHNGGCRNLSRDTLRVQVQNVPVDIADAGEDQIHCGNALTLDALAPAEATGFWSWTAEELNFSDHTDANATVSGWQPDRTYQLVWNLAIGNCGIFMQDSIAIEVNALPADVVPAKLVDELRYLCEETTIQVEAQVTPPNTTGQWSSPNNLIFNNIDDNYAQVSGFSSGENLVIWTLTRDDCPNYSQDTLRIIDPISPTTFDDSLLVSFNDVGAVIIVTDNDNLPEDNFDFTIINYPDHGSIEIVDTGMLMYRADDNYFGLDSLAYKICVAGCETVCDTAWVNIDVFGTNSAGECFFSNIITPNGDGDNDNITVSCATEFPNNQLTVFNRWGGKVFEASPYNNEWEGEWNGKPLPAGVYFYVFKPDANNSIGIQGHFSIFR